MKYFEIHFYVSLKLKPFPPLPRSVLYITQQELVQAKKYPMENYISMTAEKVLHIISFRKSDTCSGLLYFVVSSIIASSDSPNSVVIPISLKVSTFSSINKMLLGWETNKSLNHLILCTPWDFCALDSFREDIQPLISFV